jgi:phosphatidate cytidylyltransferase
MRQLGPRVATGLGLAAVAVGLIGFAPWWVLGAVVTGLLLLAMDEFSRLTLPSAPKGEEAVGLCCAALLPWTVLAGPATVAGTLALIPIVLVSAGLAAPGDPIELMDRVLKRGWGLVYLGGAFCSLLILAAQEHGRVLVFFAVGTVVAADSGAYFAGHLWGRRHMAPRLSPGKTWEGLVGGLVLSATLGAALAGLSLPDTSVWAGALLGITLGLVSVMGDLLESGLKRAAGAKDSGWMLPGHGGLLDRVDGILSAAPVLLICRELWW